jgi:hypothetical protein
MQYMSQFILRGFCSITLLAALSGCGNSPEATVKQFYTNVEKGEISEAKTALSPQLSAFLGDRKLGATLAGETERIGKCGGIKSITSALETKGEVSAGTTTVEYKGECKPRVEKTRLVKENGNWKITANK